MIQEDPVYEVLRALETIKLYKEFYFAGATQNSASTASASSSQSVFSSDTFSHIYSQNVILPDFTDVSLGDRTVEGNIIPHSLSPLLTFFLETAIANFIRENQGVTLGQLQEQFTEAESISSILDNVCNIHINDAARRY